MERHFGTDGPERLAQIADKRCGCDSRLLHNDNYRHDRDDFFVCSCKKTWAEGETNLNRSVFHCIGLPGFISNLAGDRCSGWNKLIARTGLLRMEPLGIGYGPKPSDINPNQHNLDNLFAALYRRLFFMEK